MEKLFLITGTDSFENHKKSWSYNISIFFFFYAYHSYLILPIQIIELGGGEHDVGLIMSVAELVQFFLLLYQEC